MVAYASALTETTMENNAEDIPNAMEWSLICFLQS